MARRGPRAACWTILSLLGCSEPSQTAQRTAVEIPSQRAVVAATVASQSGSAAPGAGTGTALLGAELTPQELLHAAHIALRGGELFVDGERVATRAELEPNTKTVSRIPSLDRVLRDRRNHWKLTKPSEPFPGSVVLELDEEVPAILVKCVFQTAGYAGHPKVAFRVAGSGESSPHL